MTPDIWQSLLLIAAGSVITLGTTSLLQLISGKQAAALDRERRADARKQADRDAASLEVRRIHDALVDIGERGRMALTNRPFNMDEVDDLVALVRRGFTLVPDVQVRDALADALTVLANRKVNGVVDEDWARGADTASFVIAAYIRRDTLPAIHLKTLSDLRLKYRPSAGPTASGA